MNIISVYQQIIILFLVMFVGTFLRKKNILKEEGVTDLSQLIFYVTLPALIIYSIGNTVNIGADIILHMTIATVLTYLMLVIISFIVPYIFFVKKGNRGMYSFFTIFSNSAFIGYPMLSAVFGEETIFFGAIYNIGFNLLLYSLGIYYIMSDKGGQNREKFSFKKVLNSGFFATLIGITIFFFGIEIPFILKESLKMVGGLTTPLSMLIIGASLANINLKSLFSKPKVLVFSIFKMTILPLLVASVLFLLEINILIVGVCGLLVAMPMGTNTVIVARKYDSNVELASEGVFLSTILLVLTSPLIIYGINYLNSL